jgi:hypothetical protein
MITNQCCKGCFTISCNFYGYNHTGDCPCTDCVIKMMCNTPCDDFTHFRLAIIAKEKDDDTQIL